MSKRVYNFSPGPAVLPEDILEDIKTDIYSYENTGIGIMEMSHRSDSFKEILSNAKNSIKELLEINDNYEVLFSTGGATQQFSMIPSNIFEEGKKANYIVTGVWAKKAAKEAEKFGDIHIAANTENEGFKTLPTSYDLIKDCSYTHYCSNNTIYGTQFKTEPEGENLVCDASSDFLHKKIDVNKYALIYAGAQKNIGPAGATIVIIRKDLLKRSKQGISKTELPLMLNYNTLADNSSAYNTPPTFIIYVINKVLNFFKSKGGLNEIENHNIKKAEILYNAIDNSELYIPFTDKDCRSLMNVTFNLKEKSLEERFVSEASEQGFNGIKGHRMIGGIRASIYNSFPIKGIEEFIEFMKEFEKNT